MKKGFLFWYFFTPILNYCCEYDNELLLPYQVASTDLLVGTQEERTLLLNRNLPSCYWSSSSESETGSERDESEYAEQKVLCTAEIEKQAGQPEQTTVVQDFEKVKCKIEACLDCNAMAGLVLKLLDKKQEQDKEIVKSVASPRLYEPYKMIMWDLSILEKIVAFCPNCSSLLVESKEDTQA